MDTPLADENYPELSRNSFDGCFKMLLKGRVQLVQASQSELLAILKSINIDAQLIANTKVVVLETSNYLAFSNQVPDPVVQQWN